MSGAMPFHQPPGQQQTQHDTENQLLLLREPVHADKIAENAANGNLGNLRATPCHMEMLGAKADYANAENGNI
jgi:hypothetical protein